MGVDRPVAQGPGRVAARLDGLERLTPNYADEGAEPVSLQLFVRPVDVPAAAFDAERMRGVAAGLLERVYRAQPGDPLYDGTLNATAPRLRPARDAGKRRE